MSYTISRFSLTDLPLHALRLNLSCSYEGELRRMDPAIYVQEGQGQGNVVLYFPIPDEATLVGVIHHHFGGSVGRFAANCEYAHDRIRGYASLPDVETAVRAINRIFDVACRVTPQIAQDYQAQKQYLFSLDMPLDSSRIHLPSSSGGRER